MILLTDTTINFKQSNTIKLPNNLKITNGESYKIQLQTNFDHFVCLEILVYLCYQLNNDNNCKMLCIPCHSQHLNSTHFLYADITKTDKHNYLDNKKFLSTSKLNELDSLKISISNPLYPNIIQLDNLCSSLLNNSSLTR